MESTLVLLLLPVLALIPASIARAKGRSFGLWYLYGLLLWIVALIHAVWMSPDQEGIERLRAGGDVAKCPHCAELIKIEAKVCKHCGRDVPFGIDQEDRIPDLPAADRSALPQRALGVPMAIGAAFAMLCLVAVFYLLIAPSMIVICKQPDGSTIGLRRDNCLALGGEVWSGKP